MTKENKELTIKLPTQEEHDQLKRECERELLHTGHNADVRQGFEMGLDSFYKYLKKGQSK